MVQPGLKKNSLSMTFVRPGYDQCLMPLSMCALLVRSTKIAPANPGTAWQVPMILKIRIDTPNFTS